jgi:transcription initiation factor TFIIIB Brf1 subunit/transcription initiation factor TFIIB
MRIFYADKNHDVIYDTNVLNTLEKLFETYEINKLDIKRMYRFLDKNVKKEEERVEEGVEEDDTEEEDYDEEDDN